MSESLRAAILLLALICGMLAVAAAAGLRINSTPSLPVGIWRIEPLQAPIVRGDIVLFCLGATAAGCPAGAAQLLKPVLGIGGDLVEIGEEGISINGQRIVRSRRQGDGPLPFMAPGVYRLAADELWVMATHHPRSYDSRCFGPITHQAVRGKARPIWVWWAVHED